MSEIYPQQPLTPQNDQSEDGQTPTPQTPSMAPSTPIVEAPIVKKSSNLRSTITSVFILLMAPAIALILTLFVFQSYQVDGPSMETTLQNNDRLIVWKAARTWARISGKQYVPNRGDVIIFNEPGLGAIGDGDDNKQLVKRVIGLPGDKVVIKDGTITIYNKTYPNGFKPDKTMAYGAGNHIPETDGDGTYTLEANQLFVCGDNRPNSLDSRIFGPITTDQVVGKLVARILPLSNTKLF